MTNNTFATPGLEPYLVLAQETFRRVYSEESPEEINTWLMTQLQRLAGKATENARLLWPDSFTLYEEVMQKRAAIAALPASERRELTWPWDSWSKLLDPLEPGLLAVLAAADGAGKTLYSECIAEHWARCGRQVVFVHFELNRSIMLDRRTVRHTGIPRRSLKVGALTEREEAERQEANRRLRSWAGGITYVHTPGWSVERVLAEANALISERLCDVLVIDYLEKAGPSPRQLKQFGSNLYEREADDVEQIKSFSESCEIPTLLLAQLNKLGKSQSFENLDRVAIRGAGQKTEKANIVILLHREDRDSPEVNVRVDKNTVGPTGSFKQFMQAARFLVGDMVTDL